MKKLTLRQELKVYELALINYQESIQYPERFFIGAQYGMCWPIAQAYNKLYILGISYEKVPEMFPRFLKLKPKRITRNGFWWDKCNRTIRITKFNRLISECKKEIVNNLKY